MFIKPFNSINFCLSKITVLEITLIVLLSIALLAILIIFINKIIKKNKSKSLTASDKSNGIKVIDNTRFTSDSTEHPATANTLDFYQTDLLLRVGETYTANKDSSFKPGKYTIISPDENVKKFNIRIGNFVREYPDNTDIILAEGDTITPVSHKIILR